MEQATWVAYHKDSISSAQHDVYVKDEKLQLATYTTIQHHKFEIDSAKMNAIKLFILDICLYINKWALRTSTGRERDELIQVWLRDISSCDPEATEPALGVYPWYASDSESYTPDIFQGNFRLRPQRCWDYYGDLDNVEPRLPPEPYPLDPKLCSLSDPFA